VQAQHNLQRYQLSAEAAASEAAAGSPRGSTSADPLSPLASQSPLQMRAWLQNGRQLAPAAERLPGMSRGGPGAKVPKLRPSQPGLYAAAAMPVVDSRNYEQTVQQFLEACAPCSSQVGRRWWRWRWRWRWRWGGRWRWRWGGLMAASQAGQMRRWPQSCRPVGSRR
jgi:hypothetical protein